MADGTTPLQGKALLVTQFELVTPTTVAGILYGIAFTLFCLYVHSLVPRFRDEDRKNQAKFMLGYSIVIMLCGLFDLVSSTWIVQDAYIKHGDYPGGPFSYEIANYRMPVLITMAACQAGIDTLTLAIQIWRVWVIWNATSYALLVITLPSLCFVAFTALRLRTNILQATQPLAELVRLDVKTEIAEIAIQGAMTVLCTMLISFYLIFRHRRQRKLIGRVQGSAGYMGVVSMLIESYALESVWLLLTAILWNQVVLPFFVESVRYIQIISYLLVQYRVARGTAYESQRAQTRSKLSSLHWNHSNHATTQFGETSELRGGFRAPAEALQGLPASSMA